MFSDNNRISGRQAFRILTYDLLGAGSLLVPGILANRAGCDGIFSIGLAVVFALFYVKVLSGVLADKKQDTFGTYLERRLGKVAGKTVSILYVVYFILLAGYVAYHFTNIISKYLLREESFLLILFILVLLAAYGLSGGLEGRARAYEILFWFVMAPLFLMLLSALDEISVDYWTPVVTAAPLSVLGGAWEVFCWLSLVFLLLFLGGSVKKQQILVRAGRWAVLFAGILYAVLYLILLGIFGKNTLSVMEYPAVTMMSTIKITGGFLKRTDAFMLAIWFFTLFALLGGTAFYGGNLLSDLFGKKSAWEGKYGFFILVAAFALAEVFYHSKTFCTYFEICFQTVMTPFIILVPVLLWMLGGRRRA